MQININSTNTKSMLGVWELRIDVGTILHVKRGHFDKFLARRYKLFREDV